MSGVSRRDLLSGAAGLVVGGGGVGAASLAGGSDGTPDPGAALPSPGEELMVEHGVLKRVLLAYRALVERIDAGAAVPRGAVTDSAQIVMDYIENFHEGLEEAYVFPRVRAAQPALVRTLLVQHDRGRHLTARLLAAAPDLRGAGARHQVRADLAAFVRMYEPHEAWEDTVVFPALRAATSPRTLGELAERFHDLADREFGDAALRQVLHRVEGIETQLGIADLASFTP
ncbi:Hemerythrin-like domain-containing protein [Jatrophihabitans endophyticus]|uniref:Hemerythrin-like domain-containing protein n=1 Tax=Jatrophihabitans endophyticus TaxID=1206085 RepID=A0A1M5CT00_9ACTN|nr:hemerythrin domain-containing protein [Jatrophihabitans endophyticus]SHF57879.1 Hemerythrin-like domain-containing protein [Jatrophihabitans endophyticus]